MGKVIIRVLGGISQDCFLRGIEEFNKENESKIEAEIVEMTSNKTSNEIHDLCLKALRPNASDEKIDVLEIPAWAQEFAQMGWLYPIDNLSDEERARFFPQFLIPLTWRNKLYGLPEYRDLGVLYYRTDMVTDPPQTWDELICQAEKFQADLRKQQTFAYGFLFQGAKTHSLVCNFLEFVNNAGGNLVDNQGLTPDALTDPQNPQPVDALKFMWNLVNAQITPDDILTYDERKTGKTFWDSSAVFSRDWLYVWGLAKKYNANTWGKMSIAPLPRKELSLPPSYLIGGWDLVISSTSDHRQEALKLVKFLILNPYLQLERAKCHASLPTLKEIYENHEFLEIFQGTCLPVTSDGWKEFLQSQVKFPPANPQWSSVSKALSDKLWKALSSKSKPNFQKVLEEAKQKTRQLTSEFPEEGLFLALSLNAQGCQLEIKRRDTNECWTRNLIKRIGSEKFQFNDWGREIIAVLVKSDVQKKPLIAKEWRPDYVYEPKYNELRKRIYGLRKSLKEEFWQELRLFLPAVIKGGRGCVGGFEIPHEKTHLTVNVQNPPAHLIIFLGHLFNQIYGFQVHADQLKTFLQNEDLVEAYKANYLEPIIRGNSNIAASRYMISKVGKKYRFYFGTRHFAVLWRNLI
jgi:multiple sugar transport system substrate-binding protein